MFVVVWQRPTQFVGELGCLKIFEQTWFWYGNWLRDQDSKSYELIIVLMITLLRFTYLAFSVSLGTVLDALLVPESVGSYHNYRCCCSFDQRFDMPNCSTCQSKLTSLSIYDDHTSVGRTIFTTVFHAMQLKN